METVIGRTTKEGAKVLFSAPAISGEDFRKAVDIYACGSAPYLSKLAAEYARKMAKESSDDTYVVWAKSFMDGKGAMPRGGATPEPPKEFFDVAFCIPTSALDETIIAEFEEMSNMFSKPFGRGHGGRGGRPGPAGRCH